MSDLHAPPPFMPRWHLDYEPSLPEGLDTDRPWHCWEPDSGGRDKTLPKEWQGKTLDFVGATIHRRKRWLWWLFGREEWVVTYYVQWSLNQPKVRP